VHDPDARNDVGGAVEVLEARHRPCSALDGPIILLHRVFRYLVAQLDSHAAVGDQAAHGGRVGQHREDLQRSATHGGLVDGHANFSHNFLEVARAQRVGRVPANAHQHDLQRAVQPLSALRTTDVSS
jgi:hypothetical protein